MEYVIKSSKSHTILTLQLCAVISNTGERPRLRLQICLNVYKSQLSRAHTD